MAAWYISVGANEQASRIFFDGMTNPESLTRREKTQYIYMSLYKLVKTCIIPNNML